MTIVSVPCSVLVVGPQVQGAVVVLVWHSWSSQEVMVSVWVWVLVTVSIGHHVV